MELRDILPYCFTKFLCEPRDSIATSFQNNISFFSRYFLLQISYKHAQISAQINALHPPPHTLFDEKDIQKHTNTHGPSKEKMMGQRQPLINDNMTLERPIFFFAKPF